jgi:hypothetical protein
VKQRKSVALAGAALVVVLSLGVALAAPNSKHKHDRFPERNIAIVVNGQQLAPHPGPRIIAGRIMVPIVRIFSALAIPISRRGNVLVAEAPDQTIRLTHGSRHAYVGRREILLDVAPMEIDATTYVPLDLLDVLGANAAYDSRSERVVIGSTSVSRLTPSQNVGAGRVRISGNLTAIDTVSEPPSLTVTYQDSVRTIAINSKAQIVLSDVVARTEQRAELTDLHVGDAVSVTVNSDGTVALIEDLYGSRTGTIAAVSATSIVLDSGRVVTPGRTTTIMLDEKAAALSDLHVGDTVTQRMNPQTGETRELIAISPPSTAPSPAESTQATTSVNIISFTAEPLRPLRLGEKFAFVLRGTPGGRATFDLGSYMTGVAMREESPGVYSGSLSVPAGMNFAQMPVYGHLSLGGVATTQEAVNKISAATIAPQITDIAPSSGQVVNNNRPSIYATFAAPTDLGIDPQSVTLKVNGKDVTSSVTRTSSFVTYTSGVPLPDGQVNVSIAVADFAGNEASRSWTFTVQTR